MTVELLSQFRAEKSGRDIQPVLLAVKCEDGEVRVAKADPTTGALIVTANINTAGLATDASLQQINTLITNRVSGSLTNVAYDNAAFTPNSNNDVWVFKFGASTVRTVTINYTDTTKAVVSTIIAS